MKGKSLDAARTESLRAVATEFRSQPMCRVYDGIMPVKKVGQTHIWFTACDYLIRWWGI